MSISRRTAPCAPSIVEVAQNLTGGLWVGGTATLTAASREAAVSHLETVDVGKPDVQQDHVGSEPDSLVECPRTVIDRSDDLVAPAASRRPTTVRKLRWSSTTRTRARHAGIVTRQPDRRSALPTRSRISMTTRSQRPREHEWYRAEERSRCDPSSCGWPLNRIRLPCSGLMFDPDPFPIGA